MKNKRKIGDNFENLLLDLLNTIDKRFTHTANSGAKWSDADIRHPLLIIEAKNRASSGGFSFPLKDYNKIVNLNNKTLKDWIYITKNKDNKIVASVDINFLLELLQLWLKDNE